MRYLRAALRLVFALEALGFLSLAFLVLRKSSVLATSQRLHLGPYTLVEVACFLFLLAILAAVASLRMERGDLLGRWSMLATSILNLFFFPFGTLVSVAGIVYFVRNPSIDPAPKPKHRPIAGDGTSKWSGPVFMMVQILWGVFVLSAIHGWTIHRGMRQIHSQALFWIVLACAVFGSILFHELGHLVLGDIVRFRLVGFGVGPFHFAYMQGRWHAQLRWDRFFGGHTTMLPKTPRSIRERAMIFVSGGPLASALLGAIGAASLLLIPGPAWPAVLGHMVALATGFAVGDVLFNLLPMATQARYSDGARLWQLYSRGPWCDYLCAHYYMGLSHSSPLRPRDWPRDMVVRCAEFAAQLPSPASSFTKAYVHFLDSGDCDRALSWLVRACEASPAGSKLADALAVDRAFLEAFHRRDANEAQRLFAQASRREESTDYWRALAAVQVAQGNLSSASVTWHKAWELAQKRPATGIYEMDREQLRIVKAWIESRSAEPVVA
jgi:hypothetical protein